MFYEGDIREILDEFLHDQENLRKELFRAKTEIAMWRKRFLEAQGQVINEDRTARIRNIFLNISSDQMTDPEMKFAETKKIFINPSQTE